VISKRTVTLSELVCLTARASRTGSVIAPMLFLSACLAFGAMMTFVMQAVIRKSERRATDAGTASSGPADRRHFERVK